MNVGLRPQHVDILSLCTGGGGLDLGVELAIPGARSVVLVEREAFAVAQLVSAMEAGLLHQAPVWSDAKSFDGLRWRGCVDGLIGGIPCQGHSLAGKKRGSLDERDLWSPARRIIVQARPWFVLIENVGGMLSPGDDDIAGAERVWRDLRKLGFAVEGGLFTASEVGASHERERIFILAVADGDDEHDNGCRVGWKGRRGQSSNRGSEVPGVGQADAFSQGLEGCERRTARSRDEGTTTQRDSQGLANAGCDGQQRRTESNVRSDEPGQQAPRRDDAERRHFDVVDTFGSGHDGRENDALGRPIERASPEGTVGSPLFPPPPDALSSWAGVLASAPELEPAFRRVADGLASRLDIARVDRLRMLGNGVVPLQAAYAVRTLATRLADRGSAGATRLVRMMAEGS